MARQVFGLLFIYSQNILDVQEAPDMRFRVLPVRDLMAMKSILILVCLPLLLLLSVQASETRDFTLPKIQVLPIKDRQADRQYELYIKLPDGYSENKDKSYPVIYFTDALWHIEILSALQHS